MVAVLEISACLGYVKRLSGLRVNEIRLDPFTHFSHEPMWRQTCTNRPMDNGNIFTCKEWDQQSVCISSDAMGSLSLPPPPSFSSLSLLLSPSPALRLPHSFLCHPLHHHDKRREACSFMHLASQLSKVGQREEGEGETEIKWETRGEGFLILMNRSPVLHHWWGMEQWKKIER